MVDVVSEPVAQVRWLTPRVGGRLALFCFHRVNRVYGALVLSIISINMRPTGGAADKV